MSDLNRQILSAAQNLFMTYGPKRTSMDDIAQAAGVSKPTIYAHLGSKDEVFRAVILNVLDEIKRRSRDAALSESGVIDKVTAVLLAKFGLTLELSVNSHHADELLEGAYAQAPQESQQTEADYDAVLRDVLTEAQAAGELELARGPLPVGELIPALKVAAIGVQQTTSDLSQMRAGLRAQTTLMLAGYLVR